MQTVKRFACCCALLAMLFSSCGCDAYADVYDGYDGHVNAAITLPAPRAYGDMSVEAALLNRRSQRDFTDQALSLEQLSQILWAAYGVTMPHPAANLRGGLRTAPSAGAVFPLEIYAVVGDVEGLEPGVYRYISENHSLVKTISGDVRGPLTQAALSQSWVGSAPVTIVYSAVFDRITARYGSRGIPYAYIELGHSAQNVYLQAVALGLGTVAVGAFIDDMVAHILQLPENETPLYLMPVGHYHN